MIKTLLILVLFLLSFVVNASEALTVLEKGSLQTVISDNILFCEDGEEKYTVNDLINDTLNRILQPKTNINNIDYKFSTYWLKISLFNNSNYHYFILEAARANTGLVEFYEVRNDKVIRYYKNGINFPFSHKKIKNRKIVFPTQMNNNEKRDYFFRINSDLKVLKLPIIVYQKDEFYRIDAKNQFLNGIYYGILILIIIIYFFFYTFLLNSTFIYYVIYVAGVFLLQFSLDGYSYQYLFSDSAYWANHIVFVSAALSTFLVLQYAKIFLNLKEIAPKFHLVFNMLQILIGLIGMLSLSTGSIFLVMSSIVNASSLFSIVLIISTIFYLRFKGHKICNYFTTAFSVLIIGAVIFILGNLNILFIPNISQNALKLSSGLEVIILSVSMATRYRGVLQAKEKIQQQALQNLEEKNKLMDTMNTELEKQVKQRTQELTKQKQELEEKNNEILSSIRYAERIQTAILPSCEQVQSILPESFVFFRPKDVVSGDFYFVEKTMSIKSKDNLSVFGVIDCTGHGVPGALMSMVGNNYLRQSLNVKEIDTTGKVLDYLNEGVCDTLRQGDNEFTIRDGMDVALCVINQSSLNLFFSGAKNPVYIIRNSILPEIEEVTKRNVVHDKDETLFLNIFKGDSHPIGIYADNILKPFKSLKIQLQKGDKVYVFSDGFYDQFGGDKGKKYNIKNFKKLLLKISQLPMEEQKKVLTKEFDTWKADLEQVDDVCVIGVSI